LTAAYELLQRTDIRPVVLEMSSRLGGLACTVNYRGNRIDIGGHRFFSKSDRVLQWWFRHLPLQRTGALPRRASGPSGEELEPVHWEGPDPEQTDRVMLVRHRRSRIYYRRRLFDYPLRLSLDTLTRLGLVRSLRIGVSYARSALWPIRPEETLEHFFINRFGRELYRTFFQSYTEKVWGRPCSQISAEWGAQRVKGLSVGKALWHAAMRPFRRVDVAQKKTETSLIEQFLYPKFGPGQMWETVGETVRSRGGQILTGHRVHRIDTAGRQVIGVEAIDQRTGQPRRFAADYVFTTMPVRQLVRAMGGEAPEDVRQIAEGLLYRDFLTVGLLVSQLEMTDPDGSPLRDNWIYIQEPDVQVGRMQIFNNWSPYMAADPSTTWIGLEYFCNEHDELWIRTDAELIRLAISELSRIGLLHPSSVLDGTVIRMPKAYPAYFGSYDRFDQLRQWLDGFENLFPVGRNGMHRYNNMDHSMLTAMVAVDNIVAGRRDKSNLWAVNAEQEYHEEQATGEDQPDSTPLLAAALPSETRASASAPVTQ
ncbi:MAG TPA: NAD(P)/FAD-dependent oxidoreductase, partial [Planctomycetaceae bacterium]|nr:NAD(P)/FAD-dependent oxidoreductase [Planctomycetaceae bacterium]